MSNDHLTIVTGASSNHFGCLCNLLTSLDRYEDARVLVHDLGLTEPEAQRLRDDGRNLAKFPFDRYPPHFGQSATFAIPYAWKPVIIHDALMAAGHPVLWLDAGNLVHERLDREREQLRTVGFYSPGSPGTIADWTHPVTLQGLGARPEILGDRNRAGGTVGFGTNDLAREIAIAWRDAAMSEAIFCPEGWSRKLHRCDQAVLSVLVAQARRRRSFTLADGYFGISVQNDEATPEQAARLMAMTAQEVRREKRMAARAGQPAQPRPIQRKKKTAKKRRGLWRLWHKLKKRLQQAAA
jgi:hypothetical protein